MERQCLDSYGSVARLQAGGAEVAIIDLRQAERNGLSGISRLPMVRKIFLENLLRHEDGNVITRADIEAFVKGDKDKLGEVPFRPARVLMQDYAGLPALLDLAALREAYFERGLDPAGVETRVPVDLVIDHSLQVDVTGRPDSLAQNLALDYQRNHERYRFLRWAQDAFEAVRIVPPGKGIVHQINIESLASIVRTEQHGGQSWAIPDTLIGTDSHTTMVNGLGVLGWGVGGIEAEAAMLGHPVFLPYPVVTGVRLVGRPNPGVLATDVVLTLTQVLRAKGVTGHFIEFFGEGVHALSVPDRATVANMAPEYGATCALFPIDALTLDYLRLTGRSEGAVQLVHAYARHQGLWDRTDVPASCFDDVVTFNLGSVETSVAGPDRPHDRMPVSALAANFVSHFAAPASAGEGLTNGDIVIAAITSCTNTSNPEGMIAAGLVARNARRLGLKLPGHVKASIAPGSQAVSRYLSEAGLLADLEAIGFTLIGFGCTTCVGNSGELAEEVASRIRSEGLTVASVISGNRNFEGRIHPLVKANYLASPPIVVACALTGSVLRPQDRLPQLWPRPQEVQELIAQLIRPAVFQQAYRELYDGGVQWDALEVGRSVRYPWPQSSYISPPSFFSGTARIPQQPILSAARPLLILGNGITTDHISPVGRIVPESDAGAFLTGLGIRSADFNAYGARRGNEEVMVRGTFANVQLKNAMVPGRTGPWTRHMPDGEEMSVYQAAERYRRDNVSLVVVAGNDYGAGSARDWAAKGTWLLGIRAVLAESFERIHRTNLALVGVLPLQFVAGQDRATANMGACDRFEILCGPEALRPRGPLLLRIVRENNEVEELEVICRLDTDYEIDCFRRGGLFQSLLPAASTARQPIPRPAW